MVKPLHYNSDIQLGYNIGYNIFLQMKRKWNFHIMDINIFAF